MPARPRKFTVAFHPNAQTLEDRYRFSSPSRDLIVAATVLQLRPFDMTVRGALLRHGFGDTDIMAGIVYPSEADERYVIPEGFVEVYMGAVSDDGERHHIHEVELLEILKQMLLFDERYELAGQVKELQDRLSPPGR